MVGQRLDKALSFVSEVGSRSRAATLIEQNRVQHNGKSARASTRVESTDKIEIDIPESKPTKLQPYEFPIEILFEDTDLAVINKPAGLVVHPAAGHEQDTLVNALVYHMDDLEMKFGDSRPGIVHRLDKDTSGVLVIAKNDWTQTELQKQFKDRSVERFYLAVVEGELKHVNLRIQSYLARHPVDRKKFSSIRDENRKPICEPNAGFTKGKWAITNIELLNFHPSRLSYLKLKLETGRTHQIRVHLSEQGHPIVGDEIYGSRNRQKLPRLALHAATLNFTHPRSLQRLSFSVSWPDDLAPYLKSWGFI